MSSFSASARPANQSTYTPAGSSPTVSKSSEKKSTSMVELSLKLSLEPMPPLKSRGETLLFQTIKKQINDHIEFGLLSSLISSNTSQSSTTSNPTSLTVDQLSNLLLQSRLSFPGSPFIQCLMNPSFTQEDLTFWANTWEYLLSRTTKPPAQGTMLIGPNDGTYEVNLSAIHGLVNNLEYKLRASLFVGWESK